MSSTRNKTALCLLVIAATLVTQTVAADSDGGKFKIKLLNGTTFPFDAGTSTTGSTGQFRLCLKQSVDKNDTVSVTELNKCAEQSLQEYQREVADRFSLGNANDFTRMLRNASNAEVLNKNLLEHMENVQRAMRQLPIDNTIFTSTLERATATLRNVTRATMSARNAQNIMDNFNSTLHRIGTLAQTSGNTPPIDIAGLTSRLQEGLRNLTSSLQPVSPDIRRIGEMTVGNFTTMMQNLTRGLPELMKRMEPLRDQSAKQFREFMGTLNSNLRDMTQVLAQNAGNSTRNRDANQDVQNALDGFQKAMSTAGNAFQDLIRGATQIAAANGTSQASSGSGGGPQDIIRRTGLTFDRLLSGIFGRRPATN